MRLNLVTDEDLSGVCVEGRAVPVELNSNERCVLLPSHCSILADGSSRCASKGVEQQYDVADSVLCLFNGPAYFENRTIVTKSKIEFTEAPKVELDDCLQLPGVQPQPHPFATSDRYRLATGSEQISLRKLIQDRVANLLPS